MLHGTIKSSTYKEKNLYSFYKNKKTKYTHNGQAQEATSRHQSCNFTFLCYEILFIQNELKFQKKKNKTDIFNIAYFTQSKFSVSSPHPPVIQHDPADRELL